MDLTAEVNNGEIFQSLHKSHHGDREADQENQQNNLSIIDSQHPPNKHTFKTALPQILAVGALDLLLFSFGMTLGFPTIVIPALQSGEDILTLTKAQISWFSSINLICIPLGCILSGGLTDKIGRKITMMLVTIPLIIAWIMFHYAESVALLYTCLVFTGLSGGLLEAPILTYVAEVAQPHLRGMLSSTTSTSVVVGILTQFLMGGLLPWRTVAAVNVMFPVVTFIALSFVPESPYWLVGKERMADAERNLCWLRGWVTPSEVYVEYTALVASLSVNNKLDQPTATWRNYTHRTFLKPYFLVSMTFFFGHFAGMTPLQTFAVTMFQDLGAPVDEFIATFYIGLGELTGSLICVILVHWTGKRPLAFISTFGNGICFIVVATYSYLASQSPEIKSTHGWIPMPFLMLAAFLSHICIKLLPWILIGEVFPGRVRSIAAGASSSIGYIFGFLANYVYIYMIDSMSLPGTFWFYGGVSILGAVFLYWYLPETEGKTLMEIERHFNGEINLLKPLKRLDNNGKCTNGMSVESEL